jgi:hypothetical protein
MRGQTGLTPIVLEARSAQGWDGEDARAILQPAVKSAGSQDDKLKRVDGSARLKPCPDTNPYGFHSLQCFHALRVVTKPSSHIGAMTICSFGNTSASDEHLRIDARCLVSKLLHVFNV